MIEIEDDKDENSSGKFSSDTSSSEEEEEEEDNKVIKGRNFWNDSIDDRILSGREIEQSDCPAQNKLMKKITLIKGNNSIAASGDTVEFPAMINPGVEVDGKRWLFPLTEVPVSEALEKAPFGKGEETVYDDSVRKTLQITPGRVKFTNPHYQKELEKIARRAACALGVKTEVKAVFHKLLVYEEGSHFVEHRDAVHRDGMFGTLVIQFPSVFEGGELAVLHLGKKYLFDQRHFDNNELISAGFGGTWVAFYGDCLHVVNRVTKGIRVVATYDLVKVGAESNSGIPIVDNPSLDKAIDAWVASEEGDDSIYVLCDHMYMRNEFANREINKDGFIIDAFMMKLKGADQQRYKPFAHRKDLKIGFTSIDFWYEYEDGHEITDKSITSSVSGAKATNIVAPNGWANVDISDKNDEDYVAYTGNESQLGDRSYTFGALVIQKKKEEVAIEEEKKELSVN